MVRVIGWGVWVLLAMLGLTISITTTLGDREARNSLRGLLKQAATTAAFIIAWLGVLTAIFGAWLLVSWRPFISAALLALFGTAFIGLAGVLMVSAFGSEPKWLTEAREDRKKLAEARKRRRERLSHADDQPSSPGIDKTPADDANDAGADPAALDGVLSIESLDPREIVGGRLLDRAKEALVFSRAGRLIVASIGLALALVLLGAVPIVARGGTPHALERVLTYGKEFPRAVGTLIIVAAVALCLGLLPAGLALQERDDRQPVISKRSVRYLVACAGYAVLAGLMVGAAYLGVLNWAGGQVRDAWENLTALPW